MLIHPQELWAVYSSLATTVGGYEYGFDLKNPKIKRNCPQFLGVYHNYNHATFSSLQEVLDANTPPRTVGSFA
jgi:hypothetical protein